MDVNGIVAPKCGSYTTELIRPTLDIFNVRIHMGWNAHLTLGISE